MARLLDVSGDYAYAINPFSFLNQFSIFDVSDKKAPLLVSSGPSPENTIFGIASNGNTMVMVGDHTIYCFDVTDKTAPLQVGSLELYRNDLSIAFTAIKVILVGNIAYIPIKPPVNSYNAVVIVVDVSNPASPVKIGELSGIDTPFNIQHLFEDAIVEGNRLFLSSVRYINPPVSVNIVLHIADISTPSSPTLYMSTGFILDKTKAFMAAEGNVLYAVGGDFGGGANYQLRSFDVSAPSTPTLIGSISVDADVSDTSISAYCGHCFLVTGYNFLAVFVGGNTPPTLLWTRVVYTGGNSEIIVRNGYAYVFPFEEDGNGNPMLQIFDIGR